ncbi:MAG: hypothetical protein ACKVOE_02510 [Rickettsiales bacterium]
MTKRRREFPSIPSHGLPDKPEAWLTFQNLAHELHLNPTTLQHIEDNLIAQAKTLMGETPQIVTVDYNGQPLQMIYARCGSQSTWYVEPKATTLFAELMRNRIGPGWGNVEDLTYKYDCSLTGVWKGWCAQAETLTPDADGSVTLHEFGHAFRMRKGQRIGTGSHEAWYAEEASIAPVLAHFPTRQTHFVMRVDGRVMGQSEGKPLPPQGTAAAEKHEMKTNPRHYLRESELLAELSPEECPLHAQVWPAVCAAADAAEGLVHLDGGKDVTVNGIALRTRPERARGNSWETALDAQSVTAYRVALNAAQPMLGDPREAPRCVSPTIQDAPEIIAI